MPSWELPAMRMTASETFATLGEPPDGFAVKTASLIDVPNYFQTLPSEWELSKMPAKTLYAGLPQFGRTSHQGIIQHLRVKYLPGPVDQELRRNRNRTV